MIPFNLFLERKVRNPLRKMDLAAGGELPYSNPQRVEDWKLYIKQSEDLSGEELKIQQNYFQLKKTLPPRAETYLNREAEKYLSGIKRPPVRGYKKIYENQGVQVFLDDQNMPAGSHMSVEYMGKILRNIIPNFLNYIREILPNRKPKFIITDLTKNLHTKRDAEMEPIAGLEFQRTIFIDWRYADELSIYIHEYAHWLADRVPRQSETMLKHAFDEMLNMYFRATKKKRLQPEEITDQMRNHIAKKLGFPDVYGLTNPDELFSVIIEYWKELPNNKVSYKFKSLVKQVINRI